MLQTFRAITKKQNNKTTVIDTIVVEVYFTTKVIVSSKTILFTVYATISLRNCLSHANYTMEIAENRSSILQLKNSIRQTYNITNRRITSELLIEFDVYESNLKNSGNRRL